MAKPKLALIPSAIGDKLYSVLPSDGSGDFDFTRDTTATRVNKDGLIETVASGDSRLNYPLIDGDVVGCPSHLLEPQSKNLFKYSEDFNQSYWQHNSNITITNSSELAPNGALNANLIEYDGSNHSFIRILYGTVPSTASTLSVFAKKGNWRYFGLRQFQGSGNDHTVFDFDTESFSNTASGQTASFEVFPNGWYRIKVTNPSPESTSSYVGFTITNSSGAESNTTGGQVANVHLFGAQLEIQSYATSYIPNYGTTAGVTRSAETANNAGDANTFNDSEGVLMAEISALANGGSTRIISLSGGSQTVNNAYINYNPSGDLSCQVLTSGGNVNLSTTNINQADLNKIAIKYKANDFALWLNGIEVDTDTTLSSTPTGLDRLNFDFGAGSFDFYGNTKQIQYFDSALTDTDLEELTSWTSFNEMANGQLYTIL